MTKKATIPVHRMDDWLSGVYLKSFDKVKGFGPSYEISEAHRHDFTIWYYWMRVKWNWKLTFKG